MQFSQSRQGQTKHSRAIAFSDSNASGSFDEAAILEINALEAFQSPNKKECNEMI